MAKKRTKSSKKTSASNGTNIKAVLALLIILLAFGILLIFNTYKENIIGSSFQLFMILAVVFSGLLVGLLFLVNKPHKN